MSHFDEYAPLLDRQSRYLLLVIAICLVLLWVVPQ